MMPHLSYNEDMKVVVIDKNSIDFQEGSEKGYVSFKNLSFCFSVSLLAKYCVFNTFWDSSALNALLQEISIRTYGLV